jgi:type IV secretory pathway protease TraF
MIPADEEIMKYRIWKYRGWNLRINKTPKGWLIMGYEPMLTTIIENINIHCEQHVAMTVAEIQVDGRYILEAAEIDRAM